MHFVTNALLIQSSHTVEPTPRRIQSEIILVIRGNVIVGSVVCRCGVGLLGVTEALERWNCRSVIKIQPPLKAN